MWANRNGGFTIVELLIVVVVIAILAAITVVAYNGISNRAKESALQSQLSQQARKLMAWKVENGDVFPVDLSAAQSAGLLRNSDDIEYVSYITSPDATRYCATAQRSDGLGQSITSLDSTPAVGECTRNLLSNTSVEANTALLQNIGSTGDRTIARIASSDAQSGGYVLRLTVGASGGVAGYGSLSSSLPVGRYTGSLWIRANVPIVVNPYFEGSSARTTVAQSSQATLAPGVWTRLWRTIDVTTAGTVKVGFLAGGSGTTAQGNYVELDSFSLFEGSNSYGFYDGSSARWSWTGAPDESSSFGPARAL